MIKGRKIESQSMGVVVPVKITLKNNQPHGQSSAKLSQAINVSTQRIKKVKQMPNEEAEETQNHQSCINKGKNTKQAQKQIKKKDKINSRPHEKDKNIGKQDFKPSEKLHTNIKEQNTKNQSIQKNVAPKIQIKDSLSTKEKIEQVLKNQEAIRKGLNKSPNQVKSKKEQIAKKDVKDVQPICMAASKLTQEKQIQSQSEDEEIQRQELPDPIQAIPIEQQIFAIDNDVNFKIDYQDSSLSEEAFSFLPQKDNPQAEQSADLPINMDLFELTADQLLALDYFPI